MKSRIFNTFCGAALAVLLSGQAAHADLITINFTADNIVGSSGLCSDSSCLDGQEWDSLGSVPNRDDWRQSDSVTVDLDPGTYWFVWYVYNNGAGSNRNPAGLLAEILADDFSNYSSSGWEVTTDQVNWTSATEYGLNGGNNIWTNNLGGPVAGISTNAAWLWTDSNFGSNMDQFAGIRTSITIVPEPGTLALLGLGLVAAGAARRRKS